MDKTLTVGPGPNYEKKEGEVTIDIIKGWGDYKVDIRTEKFPFRANTFDHIDCQHTLEHVQLNEHFIHVMWEMWYVLKPGGTVYIEVPHKDSDAAYESIEHSRYFTENSFVNFYNNPYAKEMKYPIFNLISLTTGDRGGHKTVCVTLQKPC